MKDLLLVFGKEYRYHLILVGEPLLPVLIIEVLLNVLLRVGFVLLHDEFVERVLQDALEDPLAKDLEVRQGTFL